MPVSTGAWNPDPVASTARAATASFPAVGYRCSGSFAIPCATTSSSPDGTPGRSTDAFGGGACRCARMSEGRSPSNGGRPVSAWCSTHAS